MFLGYIDPGSGFTFFSLGAWLIAVLAGFFGLLLLLFKKLTRFFKKRKKICFVILLLALVSALIVKGAIMDKNKTKFDKRIIVIGFDGLSPEIIEPMMQQGMLPGFSYLKEHGSYLRLATTNPAQSPVAWAGFATGKNPGKNGIFDFIVRDPVNYKLDLSLSNLRRTKPENVIKTKCFWQYTSQAKIPTVIIKCPLTFPAQKVSGRMLSGMGTPDVLGTEGTFSFYTTQMPENKSDIGGQVFYLDRSPVMSFNLIGPRVASLGAKSENVKIPAKIILQDKNSVTIEYQNTKFELKKSKWSDWKDITFNIGALKKIKGILKFYLVEVEPEVKLYAGPINLDPRAAYFPVSYPKSYSREIADMIGLYHTQGEPMATWAVNENRLTEAALLEQINEITGQEKKLLDIEIKRLKNGVLFFYFGSSDIIQHMFWRYTDPRHPLYEEGTLEYRNTIAEWYKKMDGILADILKEIGKDDTLIVLSDHGFNTFRRAAHINSWLRENGYLKLKNNSTQGSELLKDVDWHNTRAYAIGFGGIYLNQKGREGSGIVSPGAQAEALKAQLSEKLKQWRDDMYDLPVVSDVYMREQIFWGDYAADAPDLYVGFNAGYRASWQTALGAAPKQLIEDNLKKWSGDHLFDPKIVPGVIFSNKRITKNSPSIYDIAPTILKVTGYDKDKISKCDFDGTALF